MANRFNIKQNDTSPVIRITCRDNGNDVVPVTGGTIRFLMRDSAGTIKVNAAGTVVDGASGIVEYEWVGVDTDVAGTFEAEFEITYANSKIETFPNAGYISVIIDDDID